MPSQGYSMKLPGEGTSKADHALCLAQRLERGGCSPNISLLSLPAALLSPDLIVSGEVRSFPLSSASSTSFPEICLTLPHPPIPGAKKGHPVLFACYTRQTSVAPRVQYGM
ncbi:unnamed protein product [Pipistrellus nathusii]|uniref:Uncharacterized protein n=1 Tax=Pipistrellus nathusii TaxID=59473 RepID=A0ABN9ZCU1_PIPNA